jgi:DUF4097 and DUF4098 domain-containing protein YvlB
MIVMICMALLWVLPSVSTDEWSKTFNIERNAKLRVETTDANIRVTSWEGATVVARITTQGWTIGADGINIVDRQTGDQIDIEVRFPRQTFQLSWRNRRVDIEIKVPRQADLDLHTADGNVDVQSVNGTLLLHSGDGNLHLSDLQGSVKAETGDGNIDMRSARGELSLHTGDGNIDLAGVDGSLRAETGDGRVRVNGRFDLLDLRTGDGGIEAKADEGSKLEANWRLNTGDGNVTLRLPGTISANVELQTNDGSIDLDLPVTVSGRQGKKEVHGQINGGGKLLSMKTGDGSIRLEKY